MSKGVKMDKNGEKFIDLERKKFLVIFKKLNVMG